MTDKYQALREAAEKATPGEWSRDYRTVENGMHAEEVFDSAGEAIARLAWHPVRVSDGVTETDREENARYIAICPQDARGSNPGGVGRRQRRRFMPPHDQED